MWDRVTDFGDSAVTLPLAALTLAFLLVARQYQAARAWLLAVGGCAAAIGALKLLFGACGGALGLPAIVSPSGHTAVSTAVYGSLALLIAAGDGRRRKRLGLAGAALAVGLIAASRLALDKHGAAEVLVGLAVGAAAVICFRRMAGNERARLPLGWFALCAFGLAAALYGTRWRVEPAVHDAAGFLRLALPWCR